MARLEAAARRDPLDEVSAGQLAHGNEDRERARQQAEDGRRCPERRGVQRQEGKHDRDTDLGDERHRPEQRDRRPVAPLRIQKLLAVIDGAVRQVA